MILPPGRYPFLASMGMGSSIASGFDVGNGARSGEQDRRPVALYDGRRRDNERLYEVPVTSVRAVVGPPEQRCWIEREQVSQDQRRNSVPGALAGAVIGGILGHQVGGGSGNTIATVGGMIAGGAIGANIGGRIGGSSQAGMQDVQRCTGNPGQVRADLWDVTYSFNGQEHRAQMTMDATAAGPRRGRKLIYAVNVN